jgi:4-methyl-5(b-hydroxyethyl)-thiazole monophosphate biosynthesis
MPGASTFRDCKLLENMVKKHVEKGKLYAAICASPAVALGAWGLLNGLKVNCHPLFIFCTRCIMTFH